MVWIGTKTFTILAKHHNDRHWWSVSYHVKYFKRWISWGNFFFLSHTYNLSYWIIISRVQSLFQAESKYFMHFLSHSRFFFSVCTFHFPLQFFLRQSYPVFYRHALHQLSHLQREVEGMWYTAPTYKMQKNLKGQIPHALSTQISCILINICQVYH